MSFELNPRLQQDCITLGSFSLCRLLLMNDSRFPWCILVPQREEIGEIHNLSEDDQLQLMKESCLLAACLEDTFRPDKLNVAALGNMVSQLHVHHVVRFRSDAAWPKPIWGVGEVQPYTPASLARMVERLIHEISARAETKGLVFKPW